MEYHHSFQFRNRHGNIPDDHHLNTISPTTTSFADGEMAMNPMHHPNEVFGGGQLHQREVQENYYRFSYSSSLSETSSLAFNLPQPINQLSMFRQQPMQEDFYSQQQRLFLLRPPAATEFIIKSRGSSKHLRDPFEVSCISCGAVIMSNETNADGQCFECHEWTNSNSRSHPHYSVSSRTTVGTLLPTMKSNASASSSSSPISLSTDISTRMTQRTEGDLSKPGPRSKKTIGEAKDGLLQTEICPKRKCSLPAAPGYFCCMHGGDKKEVCKYPKCDKQAAYGTSHCKAHGGGKRCTHPGCDKSAQDGGLPFCSLHGGGKRCKEKGCSKGARGLSGRCQAHGGGGKCKIEGCQKIAREITKLCKNHEREFKAPSQSSKRTLSTRKRKNIPKSTCKFDGCDEQVMDIDVPGCAKSYCIVHQLFVSPPKIIKTGVDEIWEV